MVAEMSRQHQDAIENGMPRGAQHVAEQMNSEQHRRQMVQDKSGPRTRCFKARTRKPQLCART